MSQHDDRWSIDTLLVHAGVPDRLSDAAGRATVLPIHASTTYLHPSAEALDQAFTGSTSTGERTFFYARYGNPNACAFEESMAQAESGIGAVAFGSGMAAIHAALLAAGLSAGTKVLASRDLYGPTTELLRTVFAPIGVEVVLADLCSSTAVDVVHAEQPDVILVETISNPLVKVVDLDAMSTAAQEVGAVTVVDSTFTTPYLVKPIEHGFDLVVHSATKYIGGHGDSTAGVAISAKYTLLDQLRTYAILLGAMLSPFESHLLMRGLRTLALRVERQCKNAAQVAHFLQQHPSVARVHYPGLSDHPQHAIASRLFRHYGGLLAFTLKEQSRATAFRFMNRLQLCLPATTLGDVFSLVSYPPISSHRTLTEEERSSMGITEGCIRLSVGIEHVQDIISDLAQALE
jgi:cystathionine gamma-synthase/methionine-gamma-lyase